MNPIINVAMNMLKSKNPTNFNRINQAMQIGTNPQPLLKQFMKEATPEQIQGVIQQAQQLGCPEQILKQIQNMK